MIRTTTAILILTLTSTSLTWHSLGHLTVARIAAFQLSKTQTGTKALSWSQSLLRPFSQFCGEKNHPFTECATWPDKIKTQSWMTMFTWHFQNQVLNKPGYHPKPKPVITGAEDVVWAINSATDHLSSRKEDDQGKSKSILGKSIAMRNLIHFVGDIHQPLHTTGQFSASLPDGDEGGNLFPIKRYPNKHWNNLHFVWDQLFDLGEEVFSPLTQSQYAEVSSFGKSIMEEFTYESLQEQIEKFNTPEDWAKEGFEISKNFVYVGVKENEAISAEYEKQGKIIVKRRLALAGYRLSNRLTSIYQQWVSNGEEAVVLDTTEVKQKLD